MTQSAMNARPAAVVVDARRVLEGPGIPILRALPTRQAPYEMVDPFLLLDEGRISVTKEMGGFPPHPHRGFEILTYSLRGPLDQRITAEGFEDSVSVGEGGLLRITAGRGMYHGEGGSASEGREMHVLQLWVNLARAEKQVEPSLQGVEPDEMPVQRLEGATVRTLVGEGAPTRLRTPAFYQDVNLQAGTRLDLPIPTGWQGFAYVITGTGVFGSNRLPATEAQLVALGPGESFAVEAGEGGLRFVLAAGRPYREAPRWNANFVD